MARSSQREETYVFVLYVAGIRNSISIHAIDNFHRISELLADSCELEIVDIYTDIEQAEVDRISATPTLVRVYPLPRRQVVGDLSDASRILGYLK